MITRFAVSGQSRSDKLPNLQSSVGTIVYELLHRVGRALCKTTYFLVARPHSPGVSPGFPRGIDVSNENNCLGGRTVFLVGAAHDDLECVVGYLRWLNASYSGGGSSPPVASARFNVSCLSFSNRSRSASTVAARIGFRTNASPTVYSHEPLGECGNSAGKLNSPIFLKTPFVLELVLWPIFWRWTGSACRILAICKACFQKENKRGHCIQICLPIMRRASSIEDHEISAALSCRPREAS
jgi:hypothetical protein